MNYFKDKAIRVLYPDVVTIRSDVAYDANEQEIEYDTNLVNTKALEIEEQFKAEEQAKQNARKSALNKLMALGLTETEALTLHAE